MALKVMNGWKIDGDKATALMECPICKCLYYANGTKDEISDDIECPECEAIKKSNENIVVSCSMCDKNFTINSKDIQENYICAECRKDEDYD